MNKKYYVLHCRIIDDSIICMRVDTGQGQYKKKKREKETAETEEILWKVIT